MTLARKGLLKTLGLLSLDVQGQRPIFKPSQQWPKCALCPLLNESRSPAQPSLPVPAQEPEGMAFAARRVAGRSNSPGFSGRREDSFQRVGIQQMAFWLKFSTDSAPQGKSGQRERGLFRTLLSQLAFDRALTPHRAGLCIAFSLQDNPPG